MEGLDIIHVGLNIYDDRASCFRLQNKYQNQQIFFLVYLQNNTRPLDWHQRLEIMKGAACGLQYLHTLDQKPLIHGDIKR